MASGFDLQISRRPGGHWRALGLLGVLVFRRSSGRSGAISFKAAEDRMVSEAELPSGEAGSVPLSCPCPSEKPWDPALCSYPRRPVGDHPAP